MKNYLLFRSELVAGASNVLAEVLPGQPIEKEMSDDLKFYEIQVDIRQLVTQSVGCMFIASDYTLVDDAKKVIIKQEHMIPMLEAKETFIFPIVSSHPEKQDLIDYFIDQLILNPNYDNDKVKQYAHEFEPYGYTFDWDAKTSIKLTTPGSSRSGSNLKLSIAGTYPVPKREDIGFHIDGDLWVRLVRNILVKEPTLLTGPTGCGKTEVVQHLSKTLGLELSIVDMGTVLDASASLAGVHRLNSKGESEFDYAPFAEYIQKPGIVLLDEVNRSSREANNYLFPCLDGRRYMPVDTAVHGGQRRIDVHEDTVFFGTANIGVEYSGANRIDRALMDRFEQVEMDYPQEDDEVAVLIKRAGVDEKEARTIVKVSNEIRSSHKKGDIQSAVSVRHTLKTAGYIRDGFDMKKAMEYVMMPLFEDGDGVSDRSTVRSMIAAF